MSKLEGNLNEEAKLVIIDLQTNTVIINAVVPAGPFSYPGLTSYDKLLVAMRQSDGKSLAYGKVSPAGEDPVEATYNIVSGGDDGYVRSDNNEFKPSGVEVAMGGNGRIGFTRFTGIPIPQGSTIEYAFVRFRQTGSAGTGATNYRVNIQAHAVDNAVAPSSFSQFQGVGLGSEVVSWQIPGGTAAGSIHDSEDISAVIQEVVQRAGWVSGNAIMLKYSPTGSSYRFMSAFEHSTYPEPELHLRFVAP